MEKQHLDRRLDQMRAEGTTFRAGVNVGVDITGADLRRRYDAVVLAVGATRWRGLDVPGADLAGVHQAMEYLPLANRVQQGDLAASPIDARGRHVVILGGGDTGADCLGTAHRQGAASVTQLEILPRPTDDRPPGQPWPTYPMVMRTSSAHEEGGERVFAVSTRRFAADGSGRVRALEAGRRGAGGRALRRAARHRARGRRGPGAARDGLRRAGDRRSRRAAGRHRWTRAARSAATRRTRRRSTASSSPATPAAASRSSSGRSPRGGRARPASTAGCPGRPTCPRRSRRPPDRLPSELANCVGRVDHMRRAKVVCTLGPATSTPEAIRALVEAGMDVARLNLSHGSYADHEEIYRSVRRASDETGHGVGILVDLQGPKIRLGTFAAGPVLLTPGQLFTVTTHDVPGTDQEVLDDVRRPAGRRRAGRPDPHRRRQGRAVGRRGGRPAGGHPRRRGRDGLRPQGHQPARGLRQRPGDVREGHRGPALGTAAGRRHDRAVVRALAPTTSLGVHRIMDEEGIHLPVLAKIEKPQAVERPRGDRRGVRRDHGRPRRPRRGAAAARTCRWCRSAPSPLARDHAKPVIVATQMLESMIGVVAADPGRGVRRRQRGPRRRRRADAVRRDVVGRYPIESVAHDGDDHRGGRGPRRSTQLPAAGHAAPHTKAGAICRAAVGVGEVGRGELPGGVHRDRPLGAAAGEATGPGSRCWRSPRTRRPRSQLALCWGVETFLVPEVKHTDDMVLLVDSALLDIARCEVGEQVVIVAGAPPGIPARRTPCGSTGWATPSAVPRLPTSSSATPVERHRLVDRDRVSRAGEPAAPPGSSTPHPMNCSTSTLGEAVVDDGQCAQVVLTDRQHLAVVVAALALDRRRVAGQRAGLLGRHDASRSRSITSRGGGSAPPSPAPASGQQLGHRHAVEVGQLGQPLHRHGTVAALVRADDDGLPAPCDFSSTPCRDRPCWVRIARSRRPSARRVVGRHRVPLTSRQWPTSLTTDASRSTSP